MAIAPGWWHAARTDEDEAARPAMTRRFKEALARVQHLFVDRPGVRLTAADAAQMAGLDRQVCRVMLQTLTDTGVLEQRMKGLFVSRSADSREP
jgi:hypothetical protein